MTKKTLTQWSTLGNRRATATLALLVAGAAWADAPEDRTASSANTAAAMDAPELAEIIVTAQRRSERLQDVPISVTAFDENELQQRGAKSFEDIARTTPGLALTPGQLGMGGQPTIRGVASAVGAATVGVYIDDTPIQLRPTPFAANPDPKLFDISRIEVLRGPQGTLFGASSMGGTIRYITAPPSFDAWNGHVRAEGDGLARGGADYEIGAAAGGPLVPDQLALRASAYYRHEGGYIDRASRDNDSILDSRINGTNTVALRTALDWRPIEGLQVTPAIFYQKSDLDDLPLFEVGTPTTLGLGPNTPLTSGTSQLRQHNLVGQPGKDEFVLPSLTAEYAMGVGTLTSVTSYFYRNDAQRQDYSTVLPNIIFKADYLPGFVDSYTAFADSTIRQQDFTQELRLASEDSGQLRWLVGAYYRHAEETFLEDVTDESINSATLAFIGAPVQAIFGSPLLSGSRILSRRTVSTEKELAGFGDLSYKITPTLEATAGVRVSRSTVDYVNDNKGPVASGLIVDTGSQRETPVTPKLSLAYHPSADQQLYVTAQKGFRPGGVNQTVPQQLCAASIEASGETPPKTFRSDSLWSYEAGLKSMWADRRITVNASVYDIEWKNIQQFLALPGCGFGYNANLGAARIKGFELEIFAKPFSDLTLGVHTGYTDAKFSQDVLGAPDPATGMRTIIASNGDRIIGVPDWTTAINLDYRHPFTAEIEGYFRADYQYVGDSRRTLPQGQTGYIESIYRANAYRYTSLRLGTVLSKRWDISLFVNNVFNSRPLLGASTSASPASGLIRGTTLRPRQIGMTVSYPF